MGWGGTSPRWGWERGSLRKDERRQNGQAAAGGGAVRCQRPRREPVAPGGCVPVDGEEDCRSKKEGRRGAMKVTQLVSA